MTDDKGTPPAGELGKSHAKRLRPEDVPPLTDSDFAALVAEARRERVREMAVSLGRWAALIAVASAVAAVCLKYERFQSLSAKLFNSAARSAGGGAHASRQTEVTKAMAAPVLTVDPVAEELKGDASEQRLRELRALLSARTATEAQQVEFCRLVLKAGLPTEAAALVEKWVTGSSEVLDEERRLLCIEFMLRTEQIERGLAQIESGGPMSEAITLAKIQLLRRHPAVDIARLHNNARQVSSLFEELLQVAPTAGNEKTLRAALVEWAGMCLTMPLIAEAVTPPVRERVLQRAAHLLARGEDTATRGASMTFEQLGQPAAVREQMLADAARRIVAAGTADERRVWSLWLIQNGEGDRLAALAQGWSDVDADREKLVVFLDALAAGQRWPEIESWLDSKQPACLDEPLLSLYRWRCARESGASPEVVQSRQQRILTAMHQSSAPVMLYAARYLHEHGDAAGAAAAYRECARSSEAKTDALRGLWQALRQQPAAQKELQKVLEEYTQLMPLDVQAANELAQLERSAQQRH